MQPRPTAGSVNSLLAAASEQAYGAAEDFNDRLQLIVEEAAALSRLEVLPSGVRTALTRIVKEVESGKKQINSLLARNLKHEPCRILDLSSSAPRKQP